VLKCFVSASSEKAVPIKPVPLDQWDDFLTKQTPRVKQFLQRRKQLMKSPGMLAILNNSEAELESVFVAVESLVDLRGVGALPKLLPEAQYILDETLDWAARELAAIYWGLGAYQFSRYQSVKAELSQLVLDDAMNVAHIETIVSGVYLSRDLINTPTQDLSPADLAEAIIALGKEYNATVTQVIGDDLLTQGYRAIHAVGRAAHVAPRLVDLRWGDESHPKVTLVGKGVCFDTGGLNIKSADGMQLMKKDMSGSACVLGLAQMIMCSKLKVRLRVLIPAIENAISGNAYRPGDVIKMRSGKTVEVTNTDAEGRLVLADSLIEASLEKPDFLINMASLTGAARVALGPSIGNLFTHDQALATDLMQLCEQTKDYLWHLPLFKPYLMYLTSKVADLMNSSFAGHAGSMTAALFLNEFIAKDITWLHIDMSGWTFEPRPGHDIGGDPIGIRTLFAYLSTRY